MVIATWYKWRHRLGINRGDRRYRLDTAQFRPPAANGQFSLF